MKPKLYIKNENMSKKIEFIDLGLPSGRLWAKENEEGYFTYDKAKEKFGELLPKPEAFEELYEECQWLWDVKNKGMIVVGTNKNTIFLPAWGYGACDGFNNRYSYGYYCSSEMRKGKYTSCPIILEFNAEAVWPVSDFHCVCAFSVRLCREV